MDGSFAGESDLFQVGVELVSVFHHGLVDGAFHAVFRPHVGPRHLVFFHEVSQGTAVVDIGAGRKEVIVEGLPRPGLLQPIGVQAFRQVFFVDIILGEMDEGAGLVLLPNFTEKLPPGAETGKLP